MKYVILIYGNPASREIWDSFSPEQKTTGLAAYAALDEELAATGELIVSEALADPSLATRIPAREGQALTTDGPFAEVKEQLAGFFLIECETAERARTIAEQVPEAEFGLVEVRPVLDLNGLEM